MKKRILLIITLSLLAITGCGSRIREEIKEEIFPSDRFEVELTENEAQRQFEMQERNIHPFFASLSEKEQNIYLRICTAIEEHDTSEIILGQYDTKEECEAAAESLGDIYRYLVYEQPEYFWVNLSEFESLTWDRGEKFVLGMKLSYLMEQEEAEKKRAELQDVVESKVQEAKTQEGVFEQVLCVYDTIAESVTYDYALAESTETAVLARSSYGCLVEGKTVCSGYALAFNLIMQELGYECGVEFDEANMSETSAGHVWNYAKLDGECYYFDLTWDDTIFDSDEYRNYFGHSHQYFAITKQELPHTLSEESITPECSGTKYNYFIYNNLNLATYDFASVKEMILRQENQGYAVLRFDSVSEMKAAEQDLLTNQKLYEILPNIDSVMYVIADSGLHLYLFFLTG